MTQVRSTTRRSADQWAPGKKKKENKKHKKCCCNFVTVTRIRDTRLSRMRFQIQNSHHRWGSERSEDRADFWPWPPKFCSSRNVCRTHGDRALAVYKNARLRTPARNRATCRCKRSPGFPTTPFLRTNSFASYCADFEFARSL